MTGTAIWTSNIPLRPFPQNLACMLNENYRKFGSRPAYQEVRNSTYHQLTWAGFCASIRSIQQGLQKRGLSRGDRVAIISRNRLEMLELELAVMGMGAVAVPIFAAYTASQTEALVKFCDPRFVAVAETVHYAKIGDSSAYEGVICFEPFPIGGSAVSIPFPELLAEKPESEVVLGADVDSNSVCLMMYTSGTMGKPKCVQLTHRNILSQQAAGRDLWPISEQDRFLSYLPWHHSYGGIFEKYSALSNGAMISLEHGYGKDLDTLLENWRHVKPTVFYSVPLIYQALVTRAHQDLEAERLIFHPELRFVFTAAAPLPKALSDEFEDRGIEVLEGWGLTETTPCCTIAHHGRARVPGVVGTPIPGVSVRIADDGEILISGPNVMAGYYKNPEENAKVFTEDGWFRTGDVGEFTEMGLKLISRKDRIFKLSNAEKVVAAEIETMITHGCPYLAWAFVTGSGREYPVALLFPNRAIFSNVFGGANLPAGCCRPGNVSELSHCLSRCLSEVNRSLDAEYCRLPKVVLLDHELSIDREELTPSMKLAPHAISRIYKATIDRLYEPESGADASDEDWVYVISLEK